MPFVITYVQHATEKHRVEYRKHVETSGQHCYYYYYASVIDIHYYHYQKSSKHVCVCALEILREIKGISLCLSFQWLKKIGSNYSNYIILNLVVKTHTKHTIGRKNSG